VYSVNHSASLFDDPAMEAFALEKWSGIYQVDQAEFITVLVHFKTGTRHFSHSFWLQQCIMSPLLLTTQSVTC